MKNLKKAQQYKIAVVANMSAGKSTFINALFGDSILPAYSKATTDCPIYIYSDDDPSNDKAIIEFTDNKPTIELTKEDVHKKIKLYAQKDEDTLEEKYKNVKRIDLYWDFKVLQNSEKYDIDFVVIDTPGPNNTDEHSFKHSSATKDIIQNEVDMVLYLFDYGQIDANLQSSENNLWGMIKERKEKNPNFEVFFIINKIDRAFEDNKKIEEIKNSSSKEEFFKNVKKYWFYYEKKAIEKIKNSAIKYGFKSPKIFSVSSKYIEYYRNNNNLNFDNIDDLNTFQNYFKNTFKDSWEKEFIKYLGFLNIEQKLNEHLKIDDKNFKQIKRKKFKYKNK
ncbi:dynamin family protein [Aliarcobacter butzleri]|uniref:dynamin family protein n=1 Tax=Aliarcobacter butzleri TaxID=28197 RepID=UPI001EDAA524|nr:dynamin family protein [Aliarcobacter butzleri]MCG3686859.1 dynamin family protein [Aliarcobacter butzleri]